MFFKKKPKMLIRFRTFQDSAVSCYFAPSPSEWIEREPRYELLLLRDTKVICFCDVISCGEVTNLLLSEAFCFCDQNQVLLLS